MTPLILLGDLAPSGLETIEIAADPAVTEGLVLANLETPLCTTRLPAAPKAGPSLRSDPAILASIATAFPRLALNLANNHMMDFGPEGLATTVAACEARGIAHFGAGANLARAQSPRRIRIRGLEALFLGACERQFGVASLDTAGVSPFTPDLVSQVAALKPTTDRLIVSLHGASEMSPWPAPRWQLALRSLISAGADLVHGHHAHVPQGFERFGHGWIVYGAGNTIVNPTNWPEGGATLESWRFCFDLDDFAAPPRVSTWALSSAQMGHVRLAPITHAASRLAACNAPLANPVLLEGLWQENASTLWRSFYRAGLDWQTPPAQRFRHAVHVMRHRVRALFRSKGATKDPHSSARFLYHLFACEHHAEAIVTALSLQTGESPDRRNAATRALAAAWLPGWAADQANNP